MTRSATFFSVPTLAAILALSSCLVAVNSNAAEADPKPAPEFTETDADAWINSKPLKLSDLRGKVVLVDFWAFECWNCYRSFPWLNALESRYAPQGLHVIGVHSPEFDHEKDADAVRAKTREFKLHHPVMLDNDFSYWKALNNRFWPAYYLIDKSGNIRALYVGETHEGDRRAQEIEAKVKELMAEPDHSASISLMRHRAGLG
jgi:thiol-disulfide isomerase/thioredoxin